MNRRRADLGVGLLVAAVLVIGGAMSWQAYRQRSAVTGMMGTMMGPAGGGFHGPNPLLYVLGTVVLAAVVGGFYLVVRDGIADTASVGRRPTGDQPATDPAAVDPSPDGSDPATSGESTSRPGQRVLDLLPEDERRVLEPVVTSPGITQIELRDRSEFSKSKVSQTVSGLEKRGLLYRERQGRTYRVYPSDDLRDGET